MVRSELFVLGIRDLESAQIKRPGDFHLVCRRLIPVAGFPGRAIVRRLGPRAHEKFAGSMLTSFMPRELVTSPGGPPSTCTAVSKNRPRLSERLFLIVV